MPAKREIPEIINSVLEMPGILGPITALQTEQITNYFMGLDLSGNPDCF